MRNPVLFAFVVGAGALVGCSKEAVPGNLADFHGLPGKLEAACKKENDGKRFRVEGYLKLRQNTSIDSKTSLATLDLVDALENYKQWVGVDLKDGKHIDFLTGKAKAAPGYKTTSAAIEAVTLHTDNGDATTADKLAVTFDVDVVTHFQTKEVTACTYPVVSLKKL